MNEDSERLARDLWEADVDACLTDIEEAGHTVEHDEDGRPVECVDECPACAAGRLRGLLSAPSALGSPDKAPALCGAAQGRALVSERLATAEELRQDIGRISTRSADGVTTSALAVALADAGWVKVPLAETSEGR